MKKFCILVMIMLFMAGSQEAYSRSAFPQKRNIILDVDASGDDLMAILFLLSNPDVDIKAITLVNGVSNVESGAEMVLRLLCLTGHSDIPVARGAVAPLEGNNSFPAKWQPSAEKPFGLELPPHKNRVSDMSAAELITRFTEKFSGNMSILGLGPLTNIAGAIGLDPGLVNKVSCIYISDGAVYVKGAINQEYPAIHNTVSGWNQWVDAKAADIVFGSAAKIVLVPLDLTALHSPHPVLLKEGLVRRYSNTVRNVAGKSLATLFQNWIAYYHADTQIQNSDDQAPVWDLVTAAIFVNPDLCSKRQDHSIIIDTGGPDTAGQIIISDQKDPNVSICLEGSQTLFDEVILQSAAMDPVITP